MAVDLEQYHWDKGDDTEARTKFNSTLTALQNALNNGAQIIQAVGVLDKDLSAPPASPSDGDAYIVASGATGDWSGEDNNIAVWLESSDAWAFITPENGMFSWVADEAVYYQFLSSSWSILPLDLSSLKINGRDIEKAIERHDFQIVNGV